tara:strand:- start:80139 stop:80630 length:492 start_codon:yes stop_codon:yes gene_type:complete
MIRVGVLTVSTSGTKGQREDTSGPQIINVLGHDEYEQTIYRIVEDNEKAIRDILQEWSDAGATDIIITTGGTGVAKSDVTPDACLKIIDREIPGMSEAIRAHSLSFTPMAMLSRSIVGIRKNTVIITLPGSPKAIAQCLDVVKPVLPHLVELLNTDQLYNHPN